MVIRTINPSMLLSQGIAKVRTGSPSQSLNLMAVSLIPSFFIQI